MARKNLLSELMEEKLTAVNDINSPSSAALPQFNGRGAVGAMSRSLEQMSAEVDAARSITEAMMAGENVVEISPDLIDESFVTDRFASDVAPEDLINSIKDHGQQVPILVRPHPTASGRFQTAYGHRRLNAIRHLGLKAKCIVRKLDDTALVVAQGQENSARRDLSFIERASFGVTLEDRGFSRETIMSALSVDKSELSRMLSTRRSVPDEIVRAIGAAPTVGRRRWMDLADLLQVKNALILALKEAKSETFDAQASDQRFALIHAALSRPVPIPKPTKLLGPDGRKFAAVRETPNTLHLAIDTKTDPAFGAFVITELPSLYAAFLARRVPTNQH